MQPFPEKGGSPRSARPEHAPCSTWASVSGCLGHDHRVLHAIVTDVGVFARQGDLRLAAECFAHFRARLATHIALEEELIFPLFEQATGVNGPTIVMRREHEMLTHLLDALTGALAAGDETIDPLTLLQELESVLAAHDAKEERVVYPAVDAGAGKAGELPELVARLQALL